MIDFLRAIPAWLLYGLGDIAYRCHWWYLYDRAMVLSSDVQGPDGRFGPWHAMERE